MALFGHSSSVISTAVSCRLLTHAAVYFYEAWFPDWVMDVCEFSRTECHGLSLIFPITKHSASIEKPDESPSAATSLYMKDGAVYALQIQLSYRPLLFQGYNVHPSHPLKAFTVQLFSFPALRAFIRVPLLTHLLEGQDMMFVYPEKNLL